METSANPRPWLVPGARLKLFSYTMKGAIHFAQLGQPVTLCGVRHDGADSWKPRGLVEAASVYIQKLVGTARTRRLTAKQDCTHCMELYATSMRQFEPKINT